MDEYDPVDVDSAEHRRLVENVAAGMQGLTRFDWLALEAGVTPDELRAHLRASVNGGAGTGTEAPAPVTRSSSV